jgi:hypothetical protein
LACSPSRELSSGGGHLVLVPGAAWTCQPLSRWRGRLGRRVTPRRAEAQGRSAPGSTMVGELIQIPLLAVLPGSRLANALTSVPGCKQCHRDIQRDWSRRSMPAGVWLWEVRRVWDQVEVHQSGPSDPATVLSGCVHGVPWQLPKILTRAGLAPSQAIRLYPPAGCPHCRRQRHTSPARSIDAVSQRGAEDGIPPRANRPVGRRSVSQDRQETSTSFRNVIGTGFLQISACIVDRP